MYLFFDGVSSGGYIGLFGKDKKLIAEDMFQISGHESSKAVPIIDDFLQAQGVSYAQIENIISVVGPGSFTGVRTISLIINTLAYIHPHIRLTPLNFFDLYDRCPIVKSSSKQDLFVKWQNSATIEVVSNEKFVENCSAQIIFGDTDSQRFHDKIEIQSTVQYGKVFQHIILENNKILAPLYIKKPNIS